MESGGDPQQAASPARVRPRLGPRRLVFIVLVGVLVALLVYLGRVGVVWFTETHRTTPVYDPPVLAGQYSRNGCSTGVYARTAGGAVVLTATGHCLPAGSTASAIDGRELGIASGPTNWPTCDRPGKNRCTASDMAYITVIPSMIPWGRLDQIDMGVGGYHTVNPGLRALTCADVHVGDAVAFNGNGLYRTGQVVAQEVYDFPGDGVYFPCIVLTDISGMIGDSGGVVLVNGVPGGVAARVFGDQSALGFTPLAGGLTELGLTMCDTPDCGLTRPAANENGAQPGGRATPSAPSP